MLGGLLFASWVRLCGAHPLHATRHGLLHFRRGYQEADWQYQLDVRILLLDSGMVDST